MKAYVAGLVDEAGTGTSRDNIMIKLMGRGLPRAEAEKMADLVWKESRRRRLPGVVLRYAIGLPILLGGILSFAALLAEGRIAFAPIFLIIVGAGIMWAPQGLGAFR